MLKYWNTLQNTKICLARRNREQHMVFPWLGTQSKHQRGCRAQKGWGPGSALDQDEAPHKSFIQTSIKRIWKAKKQAVAKSTQNEQEVLHQTFGSLQGKRHRECSKEFPVSNESKQCMQGAFKMIAERALSFCSVRFWVFYLPITKLHDFFASLIMQLIDAGAL